MPAFTKTFSRLFMAFFFVLVLFHYPIYASPLASPNTSPGVLSGLLFPVGAVLNSISLVREAPPGLRTTNISPVCQSLNRGALLCCESLFDGRFPLIVRLTDLVGYELTTDTINGIYCRRSLPGTCEKVSLCCQVDLLSETPISEVVSLALFCRHAPKY